MLKVMIELVPHGQDASAKTLHELHIVNDGTGDNEVGHYSVFLDCDPRNPDMAMVPHTKIKNFWKPDGPIALTAQACERLIYEGIPYQEPAS